MLGQSINHLINEHFKAVNDALNDEVYVPWMTDPQEWCRGYVAGIAADMNSWAPLAAALPELFKVFVCCAEDQSPKVEGSLADAARVVHAFWVRQRRHGSDRDGLLAQLAALSGPQSVPLNQRFQ